MKKNLKKLLGALLALCMVITCIAPAVAEEPEVTAQPAHEWDHECKTDCNGECGVSPLIVVPGIMQSQVYVQDTNGGDLLTSDGFPIVEGMDMSFMFDTLALKEQFKKSIGDILGAILKRDKNELFDIILGILDESFQSHYFNADGSRYNPVDVDEYWYSLEECKNKPEKSYNYAKGYSKDDNGNPLPTTKYKSEYDFIERQVDITSYCEKYGYDHTYYYSYASFGNIIDAARGLNEYIQMVKEQTGHDKVNMVFISLGGTIGNVYLSEFCNPADIDRIVFAAAAIDGSYLLSDLMSANSTLKDNNTIYNELIPNIVALAAEEYMSLAYLGNVVARAIPEEVFNSFVEEALQRAIDECLGKLMRNCQSMWALVPSAVYPELSAKYISDDAHKALKEQTDKYYEIQKNAGSTMKKLTDEGMTIFVVCGYGLELPAAIAHYKLSADNIIQSSSTSAGGTFADIGSVLPADYKPAIDSSYISPDGTVDAGTCALPDRTWFVKGQSHLKLQSAVNDVIEMCVQLATDPSITDARENNGGYRQFNEYRDLSEIESMLARYAKLEEAGELSDADKAAVAPAVEEALAFLAKREWSADETAAEEKALYTAMYDAGILSGDSQSPFVKFTLLPFLEMLLHILSDIVNLFFPGKDFIPVAVKFFK